MGQRPPAASPGDVSGPMRIGDLLIVLVLPLALMALGVLLTIVISAG